MANQPTLTQNPTTDIVFSVGGIPKTTSLIVAERFGKRHDRVLDKIRNLDCSPDFHAHNFVEMIVEVEIGKGAKRQSPAYEMTRDGFTFLAMGFTGKEAAKWKEAYIAAFNRMESALHAPATAPVSNRSSRPALPPAPETIPWVDWYIRFDVDLGSVPGDGFDAGKALARCWLHELRREALSGTRFHNGRALVLGGLLKRLAEFPPADIAAPFRHGGTTGAQTLTRVIAGFCWALDEYAKRCIVKEPEEPGFDPVALAKQYFSLSGRRAQRVRSAAAQEGGQRPFPAKEG